MAAWLRERPGAKILLGDGYNRLLSEVDRLADVQLRSTDPKFEQTIQRLTAMKERLDEKAGKATQARRLLESKGEKISAPAGAEAALKPMSEAEFTDKLLTNSDFRSWVKQHATPEEKTRILRSIAENTVNESMERGAIGSPDAIIDMEKFGKKMSAASRAMSDFGNPQAAKILMGLGRAAERASLNATTGMVSRIYFWWKGFKGAGALQPRATGRISYGPFQVGPQEIAKEIREYRPPVKLPDTPRSLDMDIVKAAQDPELARMMKRAMRLKPWEPGAGSFLLKYYLAFEGGKSDQGKILDDKTAQEIIASAGGNLDDGLKLAQQMGYVR